MPSTSTDECPTHGRADCPDDGCRTQRTRAASGPYTLAVPEQSAALSDAILKAAGPEDPGAVRVTDEHEPHPTDDLPDRRRPRVVNGWVIVPVIFAVCALITALGVATATPKAHAAEQTQATEQVMIVSSRTCSAPLSYGRAIVTRTTGRIGPRRYWTSIHLDSTGDRYRLVTDRFHGLGTKGTIIRRARGVTGDVTTGGRSWGGTSRTSRIVAIVNGVDQRTGRIVRVTC
jgi:hypothetical protein